ncbi:MAG: hypothetical protein WBQ75_23855 [Acetobacteraceae bacterium]
MAAPLAQSASATESSTSAVAWAAIIGGAFAAAAISLILLAFGAGIGLASVSPWSGAGSSVTTFTVGAAIWLIIVQWLSSGLGGYLTGRLRTKWVGMHTDEVFFRDTVHGFLAWAVASVITAAFLASATSSLIGGGARAAGGAASAMIAGVSQGATQQTGGGGGLLGYYVDALYRSDHPGTNAADVTAETTRILAKGVANGGTVPDADKAYLSQLVAARTGLSKQDADKRVSDVLAAEQTAEAKVRQAADETRKAGAKLSFYIFFSMLVGAFIASVGGALGGRHRDEY